MTTNNAANYTPAQYNIQTGGVNGLLNNVAPSVTSGIPLVSQGSSSQPVFGTSVVQGGGTGNTTFTAYSVIAAGTTSTGAFQNVSGLGTSGQVLTSNGAGALPTWQSSSSTVAAIKLTKFTASGTWTKATSPSPILVQIIAWGGGGGGGSGRAGSSTSNDVYGGGGGGGGQLINYLCQASEFSATETVTIGAVANGGTAVASTNNGNNGTTGNDTSIGSVVVAKGGFAGGGGQTTATNSLAVAAYPVVFNGCLQTLPATSTSLPGASGAGTALAPGAGGTAINAFMYMGATGGGGGGGFDTGSSSQQQGGVGGTNYKTDTTTVANAGGAGGAASGNGGDGQNFVEDYFIYGATGGGGGGSSNTDGGEGGAGGTPSGGGGGGGAGRSVTSGAGGNGARGELWVIEYF